MAIPASIVLFFVYDLINIEALIVVILTSLFIGGILEIWAVKQGRGDKFYIWEYSNKTTLGKKILGVAVEDLILFLILTPIFCIAMWEFVKKYVVTGNIPLKIVLPTGLIFIFITYFFVYRITNKNKK
ncbi:hypothetical protein A2595_04070 [Candidatus Woesebacteria bacterium RIFOXYD1_FULL_31_53]|uniref:Uncharacterized protein n=1 Tax=Candidatus Woesebacteria bacterium GW2011_GWC2_31_9 TaxID=1618586 RepID=A0A0G0BKS6_9BACT|nr:MAG: hypothetical protein UR11_C0001G0053 [Candidatus Woesebacteria bacterium GW2011_GWC1_30_29]KKP26767.1 MAG: hypothetical protein UR13_C0002G0002 [Candidatus Woesebacteria bacterium GW2011_GWD1_31_12]KKP27342.1 MAG: hypothetical protein UR16_C0003G0002 [Candidatus Woesebacteria bacterium GW2011_GWB1_31_29]KKP31632.1 MAG: hypothetical protein UR21_C0007G0049 [Candidatus Woesebacteria bacterium GW2011_GWC2_31_9]KKP33324.1 MAG: hypothetical protein UR20_C0012G0003 [Candidatus Woesebacteria b